MHDVPEPHGDIILVHGLGGTAIRTWCWERDERNFWPAWLHKEEGLESYRVFTFGYNSNFKGAGTNLNMMDFARSLLNQLLTSDGTIGAQRTPIGNQPIIFVAHSMGGLVAKKAYVLGKHDDEYKHIISKVHGIIFLATPHRGTSYAKMLNHILSSAPLGAPPRDYIAELDTHSGSLEEINEQFRKVCGDLALVSFFETFKTSFGLHKIHVSCLNPSLCNAYSVARLLINRPVYLAIHRRRQMRLTPTTIRFANIGAVKIAIIFE